jgi:predicted nucleotidyltransferase
MNVKEIKRYFYENKPRLLNQMQKLCPEAKIIDIEIGGSIKKGTQRPDSDIDIEVHYTGNISDKDLWYDLIGKFRGYGGDYDIIPVKMKQ